MFCFSYYSSHETMTCSPCEHAFENFVHTRYIIINYIHNGKHPKITRYILFIWLVTIIVSYLRSLHEHYSEDIKKLEVRSGVILIWKLCLERRERRFVQQSIWTYIKNKTQKGSMLLKYSSALALTINSYMKIQWFLPSGKWLHVHLLQIIIKCKLK